jgi:hypothetical protein
LLTDPTIAGSMSYLLLGNIIDKLVMCDDTVAELHKLARIEGFDEFYGELDAGIILLRRSDLDAEKMKIEIEKLTHKLLDIALISLDNASISDDIHRFLDESKKEVEATGPSITEPDYAEQDNPEESTELSSGEPEKEFVSEEESDREVKSPGGIEQAFSDTGGPVASTEHQSMPSKDKNENENENENKITSEPASIAQSYLSELKKRTDDFQKVLNLLTNEPEGARLWRKCFLVFERIAEESMICGFEAFEQIAIRVKAFILKVIDGQVKEIQHAISLLDEVRDVLDMLMAADIEHVEPGTVKKICSQLRDPEEYWRSKDDVKSKLPEGQDSVEPETDDAASVSQNDIPPVAGGKKDEMTLPGEEDDDLKKLIREVSEEKLADEQKDKKDDPVKESKTTPASHSISSANLRPSRIKDRKNGHSRGDFKAFKEKADLYFSVLEESLELLEAQPDDRTLLEDLELASESLHSLTLKLDVEPLSDFPAYFAKLIKDILATDFTLSEVDQQLLKEALDCYKGLNSIDELEDKARPGSRI